MKRSTHYEVFSSIYENGFWGDSETPKSGSGSLPLAAYPYKKLVSTFIRDNSISSVLDIGHGDWVMWDDYKFEGVKYVGIDVVPDLTKALTNNFGNNDRKFETLNAVNIDLPQAQICITKDVLQHLPNQDIIQILSKLTQYDYLIICNDFYQFSIKDSGHAFRRFLNVRQRFSSLFHGGKTFDLKLKRSNSDIRIGDHRPLNLESEPFKDVLHQFSLIQRYDFSGSILKRPNLVKRAYVYKKIDWISRY